MSKEILEQLLLMNREEVADIVRKDQGSQTLEVLDWTVEPISHVIMNMNTGGLYRFSGLGRDENGEKEWVVALKICNSNDEDARGVGYWKREALAYQIRLLENLPGSIAVPRCYGVIEHPNQTWIWMEHIVEATPSKWELDHYALAARNLCSFNTGYLNGEPLPDFPWLCHKYFHSQIADNGFWHKLLDPTQANNAWEASAVRRKFPTRLKERIIQQWNEKDHFLASLERLPQVFCHNDFHRRNLMIRSKPDKSLEVIALDWNFSGNGPIGGDLGWLIGGSLFYFEREPADASALFNCCLEAYQAGLTEAGLASYLELVRIGCLISIAILPGMVLPAFSLGFTEMDYYPETAEAQFGKSGDELVAGWAAVSEFSMACADRARQILEKLDW